MSFNVFLAWGRAYASTTYLSSINHLGIIHDQVFLLIGENMVIPTQSHLHSWALLRLLVIWLTFWTSICVPLILDRVAYIMVLFCPLIKSILEWYSTYLAYRQTDLRNSVRGLEVFHVLWSISVDTFCL